jgi:hypothetical protein
MLRQNGQLRRHAVHLAILAQHAIPLASSGHSFKAGPWLIVPILIVAAIIALPIYYMRSKKRG